MMKFFGQTSASTANWTTMVSNLNALIPQQNFPQILAGLQTLNAQAQNAAVITLLPQISVVSAIVSKLVTGSDTTNLQSELSKLLTIAKREDSAGVEDRIQNEQMIERHIAQLESDIASLGSAPNYLFNLWDKLSGKNDLDPLFAEQSGIDAEIKNTPLTSEGRNRLYNHLNSIKIAEPNLWTVFGGSTLVICGIYLGKMLVTDIILGKVKKRLHVENNVEYGYKRRKRRL